MNWSRKIPHFNYHTFKYLSLFTFLIIQLFSTKVSGQEKIILNHADSLIGKTVNGEQVREAIGNVSLIHNEVKIYCNRVLQHLDKNKAELYGNVKVLKDTMSIYAPTGIYYGDESKVICPNGATLNDTKTTLKADYGIYYFITDMASFTGNVKVYDGVSYTITSDALDYFRSVDKSYARGNVKIVTDSATIYSDSLVYEKLVGIATANGNVKIESDSTIITSDDLVYYEKERKSIADNNVKIVSLNNNAVVYGNHGENYEHKNYSFVEDNAHMVQIDEPKEAGEKEDTLFIYSRKMEAFRNKPEHYIAKDSVKVIRTDFYSSSGITYYFKDSSGTGGVITLSVNPAAWKENMQVTGDSIYAYFKKDIDDIYVNKSSFAVQPIEGFSERLDQIAGVFMHMKFKDNELSYIRVDTNAASIYYTFEDSIPNGVNRASGEIITLYFKDKQVEKVKVIGKPKGTYIPENLINTSELLLTGFKLRKDKPERVKY
jgi:lipopolysaccharide export system protein LptA